jgi:co-chaperonin GroES (HSP10)
MPVFPVSPIGSLLFIEPLQLESTVAVVIDPRKSWRGKVLAAGPGAPLPDGSVTPMECKVDDIVRLKPANAIEAVFGQQKIWVVKDEDVLAIEDAAA